MFNFACNHGLSLGGEGNALYPVLSSFSLRFSGKKKVKTAVKKTVASKEQPVTSQPAPLPPPPPPAAEGDPRAPPLMEMMMVLRDTRQQISDLRQKTENALANIQQANRERRQQLEDIQAARAQLNLIHAQLAKVVNDNMVNKEATSSKQIPPCQSEPGQPSA